MSIVFLVDENPNVASAGFGRVVGQTVTPPPLLSPGFFAIFRPLWLRKISGLYF
jgi:hypothetical protein